MRLVWDLGEVNVRKLGILHTTRWMVETLEDLGWNVGLEDIGVGMVCIMNDEEACLYELYVSYTVD